MNEIVSIVIPFYNEEENITKLADAITEVMDSQSWPYEVIMVNDGSTDATWKRMKDINKAKNNFIGINFAGNYGQSSAIAAGIDHASGEYIVTLDGDLQNVPKDIPMMLNKLIEEDWDVVAGERENRQDKAFSRKLPSKFANFLIHHYMS
jgi:glycosyltransferase involved in cell wall biosynthesis